MQFQNWFDHDAAMDLQGEQRNSKGAMDLQDGNADIYPSQMIHQEDINELDLELGETATVQEQEDDIFPTFSDETLTTSNMNTRPRLTRTSLQESSRWGISQARLLRTSTTVNISTGEKGGKETLVEERTSHQDAMNPTLRTFQQLWGRKSHKESSIDASLPASQWRLTSHSTRRRKRQSCMECITGSRHDGGDEYNIGSKSEYLTSYLRWTFRTSFGMLLLFSFACFMLLSLVFAICIHVVGIYQPLCINVGGLDYEAAGRKFMDAFTLSWTTLSTVGYGNIYPNLAFSEGEKYVCDELQ